MIFNETEKEKLLAGFKTLAEEVTKGDSFDSAKAIKAIMSMQKETEIVVNTANTTHDELLNKLTDTEGKLTTSEKRKNELADLVIDKSFNNTEPPKDNNDGKDADDEMSRTEQNNAINNALSQLD